MKKFLFVSLFAITALFATSCSDNGTAPVKTNDIKPSTTKPNDLVPLDYGNKWEYDITSITDHSDGSVKKDVGNIITMEVLEHKYNSVEWYYDKYPYNELWQNGKFAYEASLKFAGEDLERWLYSDDGVYIEGSPLSDYKYVIFDRFDNTTDDNENITRYGGGMIDFNGEQTFAFKFTHKRDDYVWEDVYFVQGIGIVRYVWRYFTDDFGEEKPTFTYIIDLAKATVK